MITQTSRKRSETDLTQAEIQAVREFYQAFAVPAATDVAARPEPSKKARPEPGQKARPESGQKARPESGQKAKPARRLAISVCTGKACSRKGAQAIIDRLEQLQSPASDLKISVKSCDCLGSCGRAPLIKIGKQTFEQVKLDQLEALIKRFR
jgi:hypothetical protein